MPIIPALLILSSSLFQASPRKLTGRLVLGGILATWLILESSTIWPDHLAYFNQLAGGPDRGHLYLADSNLDWGQDLKRLKAWMQEHEVDRVNLAYFGSTDPEFYNIEYECLPSFGVLQEKGCVGMERLSERPPGIYVISVSLLVGVRVGRNLYRDFRNASPYDRIGYSLFVYLVDGEGRIVSSSAHGLARTQ